MPPGAVPSASTAAPVSAVPTIAAPAAPVVGRWIGNGIPGQTSIAACTAYTAMTSVAAESCAAGGYVVHQVIDGMVRREHGEHAGCLSAVPAIAPMPTIAAISPGTTVATRTGRGHKQVVAAKTAISARTAVTSVTTSAPIPAIDLGGGVAPCGRKDGRLHDIDASRQAASSARATIPAVLTAAARGSVATEPPAIPATAAVTPHPTGATPSATSTTPSHDIGEAVIGQVGGGIRALDANAVCLTTRTARTTVPTIARRATRAPIDACHSIAPHTWRCGAIHADAIGLAAIARSAAVATATGIASRPTLALISSVTAVPGCPTPTAITTGSTTTTYDTGYLVVSRRGRTALGSNAHHKPAGSARPAAATISTATTRASRLELAARTTIAAVAAVTARTPSPASATAYIIDCIGLHL